MPDQFGEVRLRMFAVSISRIVEHRRRWVCSTEGFVVGDISPKSSNIGLADGEDRDSRIIAMDPRSAEKTWHSSAVKIGLRARQTAPQKRGVRLADLIAIAAGELFPHGLDDLPLPGMDSRGWVTSLLSLRRRLPP
jgi:hypothetical protein